MLLRLIIVIIAQVVLAQIKDHYELSPTAPTCGILREDQFYNLHQGVADNEFPWIARVYSNSTMICIGVLISEYSLLAPASCLDSDQYPITNVQLGNCNRPSKCSVRHDVHRVKTHPNHKTGSLDVTDDIGLVLLKTPAVYSEFIQPICLPTADVTNLNLVGQYHIVTGEQTLGGWKRKLITPIVGMKRCEKLYGIFKLNDNVLCASTCDNGSKYTLGSIMMGVSVKNTQVEHYYLMGILVLGTDGCYDSSPDMFQRVDRHLDFITLNNY